MPKLHTVYFGELEYSPSAVFNFPAGLPGFEQETAFLFIEQAHTRPLVFMQSLRNAALCFLALPVLAVDADYQLNLAPEDLEALGLAAGNEPRIGAEIGCFVLLTVSEDAGPTANLMSPIVVNLQSRRALQAIPAASQYSLHHPLPFEKEAVPCL